jgi:hypothetical protein
MFDDDAPEGDEEDDDLDLSLDDDDDGDGDGEADSDTDDAPEDDAPADPPAGDKPAADEDANAQVAAAALNAVKSAWADMAKSKYPLADFDGLGIKGVDDTARAAFLAEAEASHVKKVEEFKALGLVYDPAAAGQAGDDVRDAALAAAWGVPVAGSTGPTVDQQVMDAIETEAAAGNVDGVIRQMLGGGKMAKFFFEGKRS